MKLRHILLAAAAALICTASFAIPAKPGAFKYTQPDGSVIMLERHGDEFYSWTTRAGTDQAVVLGEDGFWHNATLDPTVRKAAMAERQRVNSLRMGRRTHNNDPMTHGERHIPVLLVNFQDVSFQLDNPKAKFTALLNEKGYSAYGGTGSVQDYYYENSHGAFTPIFDVYGPVTISQNMAYYGGNKGSNHSPRAHEAVIEAARLLDDVIDFSQYDYDNDGYVDMMLMYYAGYNEAEQGPEDSIWPHQSGLGSEGVALDGTVLSTYFCTSELRGNSGVNMCGIGTTSHEFAHSLGMPDFYDTDYADNGKAGALYQFSVMNSGSYNNDGRTPPYFNSEERIILGWMTDDDVPYFTDGSYTIDPVYNDVAFRSPTDTEGEYFLYECRDETGWDYYIPKGLVVYHVDKSKVRSVGGITPYEQWYNWGRYNTINAYGDHPCFYVIPAADQTSLNFSLSTWDDFESMTFPGSKSIRTYSPVDWEGGNTGVTLSNISYSGGKVSLTVTISKDRTLIGTVTNQDGTPVQGVYVAMSELTANAPSYRIGPHIMQAPTRRVHEALTDSNGFFSISLADYEGSTALLTFSKNGYQTKSLDVTLTIHTTSVNVKLLKEGETDEKTYSYYDPSDALRIFGDGKTNSLMAAIHIGADELPDGGGRLSSVTFPTLWSAKAYYVILDAGDQRLLTYEIPGLGPSVQMQQYVTVEFGENAPSFPTGTDLFVGIAIEEANVYSGYDGYLFYITQDSTPNCYLSGFSKEQSYWGASNFSLVLSARIYGTGSGDPGPGPDDPPAEDWTIAKMGYNAIADPGDGSYAAGESFPLTLELAEGVTATAETWLYDGNDVTGAKSVSLTKGTHVLTAKVSLSDGTKETLRLVLNVQ